MYLSRFIAFLINMSMFVVMLLRLQAPGQLARLAVSGELDAVRALRLAGYGPCLFAPWA